MRHTILPLIHEVMLQRSVPERVVITITLLRHRAVRTRTTSALVVGARRTHRREVALVAAVTARRALVLDHTEAAAEVVVATEAVEVLGVTHQVLAEAVAVVVILARPLEAVVLLAQVHDLEVHDSNNLALF